MWRSPRPTIPVWLVRLVICHFHYSKCLVNNSYLHLGVFEGRELVGVMQWGYAMNPRSGARVVASTGNREYMELNRFWGHDRMPRNQLRVENYQTALSRGGLGADVRRRAVRPVRCRVSGEQFRLRRQSSNDVLQTRRRVVSQDLNDDERAQSQRPW